MKKKPGPWAGLFGDTIPAGVKPSAARVYPTVAGVSSTDADVTKSATISSRRRSSSQLSNSAASQSTLISQILWAIQPNIDSAVKSALYPNQFYFSIWPFLILIFFI